MMQKHEPEQLVLFQEEMLEIWCLVVKYNPYFPDDVERINEMVLEKN